MIVQLETNSSPSAREIAERLLKETGDAIMTADFDRFAECFECPQFMDTFEGRQEVETYDDLRFIFKSVQTNLLRLGVTEMVRECLAADYQNDGTIHTTHQSRLLRGTTLVESYPCYSILQNYAGIWKVSYSSYALGKTSTYLGVLNHGLANPNRTS